MAEGTTKEVVIDRRGIELSNQQKVYFPESGITKGELCDYYRRIAPVALPWYRNRPLSQHRFPEGIGHEGFFQKDLPDHFPDWIERVELEKSDGHITYMLANNAASLVYLANAGCITPHLFLSRSDRPHHPDRLIIDLDPPRDEFRPVQAAARGVRDLLDECRLPSYVQTTGSRGLHVIVPLDRSADFTAARALAIELANRLAERHPQELTIEQRKNKRGDRIFLDYLRNAYGQTAVAPYAVRAIEGAPVAVPLRWDEALAAKMHPRRYHIRNIFKRLARVDDPWKDMMRHAISVDAACRRIAR